MRPLSSETFLVPCHRKPWPPAPPHCRRPCSRSPGRSRDRAPGAPGENLLQVRRHGAGWRSRRAGGRFPIAGRGKRHGLGIPSSGWIRGRYARIRRAGQQPGRPGPSRPASADGSQRPAPSPPSPPAANERRLARQLSCVALGSFHMIPSGLRRHGVGVRWSSGRRGR